MIYDIYERERESEERKKKIEKKVREGMSERVTRI